MKTGTSLQTIALIAAVGLAGTAAAAAGDLDAVMLKAGDTAPPFSLPGSDGKTYTLEQFKGEKAVVIAWFPKAFTGG